MLQRSQQRQPRSDVNGPATLVLRRIEDLPEDTAAALAALLDSRGCLRPLSTTCIAPGALNLPRPLLHRLAGATLSLPPLRQRQDLGALLDRLLRRRAPDDMRLSPSARAALLGHQWPGNLRELEQVFDVAIALCEGAGDRSARSARARRRPDPSHRSGGTARAGDGSLRVEHVMCRATS